LTVNTKLEDSNIADGMPEMLEKASLNCHAANTRVKDILEKLENFTHTDSGSFCSANYAERCQASSVRPWEDSAWHSQNTRCQD